MNTFFGVVLTVFASAPAFAKNVEIVVALPKCDGALVISMDGAFSVTGSYVTSSIIAQLSNDTKNCSRVIIRNRSRSLNQGGKYFSGLSNLSVADFPLTIDTKSNGNTADHVQVNLNAKTGAVSADLIP